MPKRWNGDGVLAETTAGDRALSGEHERDNWDVAVWKVLRDRPLGYLLTPWPLRSPAYVLSGAVLGYALLIAPGSSIPNRWRIRTACSPASDSRAGSAPGWRSGPPDGSWDTW